MKFGKGQVQQLRYVFGGAFTPVVKILLWANGLVFLFLKIVEHKAFPGVTDGSVEVQQLLVALLGLVPSSVTQHWMLWQPLTYMFVHIEPWHFFSNMLGLWLFGSEVERALGSHTFWRYYIFTGIGGAVAALAFSWNAGTVTIGASGAIFGLLVAYGFLFPNRNIFIYFVLPIRAIYVVILYGLATVWGLVSSGQDGVSYSAHFGGMFFGIGWFLVYRGRTNIVGFFREFRKRRMRRKLRLISKRGKSDDDDPMTNYTNKTLH